MPSIFVSFRKIDNRWMRDRIHQALTETFGADQVFKSGESIPAGSDFAAILRRQATECRLMLVLIGTAWTDARDNTDGTRLLDRPNDWVRTEIATALAAGNRIIPVLLGDAAMLPAPIALPDDIAELAHLQFLRVPETHLQQGLQRLTTTLTELLPDLPTTPHPNPTNPATTPATTPITTAHTTSTGNAVAVQGPTKNSRIAGGNIQETKIHTGGLLTTATTFLTSKIGIAATAATIIATATTIATTTNSGKSNIGKAGTFITNQPANTAASTSGGSTAPEASDLLSPSRPFDVAPPGLFGYRISAFMAVPKGWQTCPLETGDGFIAVENIGNCANDGSDSFSGADISVNEISGSVGYCVDGGIPGSVAPVAVPLAVKSHLQSLVPDAKVFAGYDKAQTGRAFLHLCFGPLTQLKSSLEVSTSCFATFELIAESVAHMEAVEPLFWEAAQTAQLGSDLVCR